MNRIIFAFLASAGVAIGSARAEHLDIRGNINVGIPAYPAPGYYAPSAPVYVAPAGYWRDVVENVWIPPHWEVRRNYWGATFNVWERGHYETRTRRVWVDAYAERRNHERWEHERWEREHWNR